MASTLAFDPGTTVALFDRIFVTDSCALPGDLVVLAQEGGQLQRLEVPAELAACRSSGNLPLPSLNQLSG
jgi:hypothetical protein